VHAGLCQGTTGSLEHYINIIGKNIDYLEIKTNISCVSKPSLTQYLKHIVDQ